jgi:hypothetical protein
MTFEMLKIPHPIRAAAIQAAAVLVISLEGQKLKSNDDAELVATLTVDLAKRILVAAHNEGFDSNHHM